MRTSTHAAVESSAKRALIEIDHEETDDERHDSWQDDGLALDDEHLDERYDEDQRERDADELGNAVELHRDDRHVSVDQPDDEKCPELGTGGDRDGA